MPWPERNVVKYPAIFAQSDLALSAAIEVIEHCVRPSPTGDRAEVLDAHNPRRGDVSSQSAAHSGSRESLETGGYGITARAEETKVAMDRRENLSGAPRGKG